MYHCPLCDFYASDIGTLLIRHYKKHINTVNKIKYETAALSYNGINPQLCDLCNEFIPFKNNTLQVYRTQQAHPQCMRVFCANYEQFMARKKPYPRCQVCANIYPHEGVCDKKWLFCSEACKYKYYHIGSHHNDKNIKFDIKLTLRENLNPQYVYTDYKINNYQFDFYIPHFGMLLDIVNVTNSINHNILQKHKYIQKNHPTIEYKIIHTSELVDLELDELYNYVMDDIAITIIFAPNNEMYTMSPISHSIRTRPNYIGSYSSIHELDEIGLTNVAKLPVIGIVTNSVNSLYDPPYINKLRDEYGRVRVILLGLDISYPTKNAIVDHVQFIIRNSDSEQFNRILELN